MEDNNKILVADDSERNLRLLQSVLVAEGYIVEIALNGREAVDKIKDFGPDLIILDMRMPVMDGIDACRSIKNNVKTKDIPVMILTAFTDHEARAEADKAGTDEFITKPIDIADFAKRIQDLLAKIQTC